MNRKGVEYMFHTDLTRRDFLKTTGQAVFVGATAFGLESILSGCATVPPTASYNPNFKGPGSQWHTFMRSIYEGWSPGIDWKVNPNTPMVTVAKGIVRDIHKIAMPGHAGGYEIIVDHGGPFLSHYSHLNNFKVDIGQELLRDTIIGSNISVISV